VSARTVAAGISAWVLVGVVLGAQSTIAGALTGEPVALADAVRRSLQNTLPWIPSALAVVAVTLRYPLSRATFTRSIWVHVLTLPLVTLLANVLIVLAFRVPSGSVGSFRDVVQSASYWATMRFHVALLVYVVIAGLTQYALVLRQTRVRELEIAAMDVRLAEARTEALAAQIRPHFLLNTLHAIGHLWRSGHTTDADEMLEHLGDLYRRVERATRHAEILIGEEVDMVRDYLSIEEARLPDRLRVEIDVPPELRPARIPPLTLQPLVENAVKHGIQASSSASTIRVRGRRDERGILLTVEDDGPGPGRSPATTGSGTGLANARARLRALYGNDVGIEVAARSGGGTIASLRLPLERRSQ